MSSVMQTSRGKLAALRMHRVSFFGLNPVRLTAATVIVINAMAILMKVRICQLMPRRPDESRGDCLRGIASIASLFPFGWILIVTGISDKPNRQPPRPRALGRGS